MSQVFKNIYLSDAPNHFVVCAFDTNDPLYKKVIQMTSKQILNVIGYSSYKQLSGNAEKLDHTISQHIKYRLKKKLK